MARASSTLVEMGFSQRTCTPLSSAATASRAWFRFSEQTTTASTSLNNPRASSK